MVSPILVPPIQDRVIQSSLGPNPAPELDISYESETTYNQIQNSTNISINSSQYRVYHTALRNPTNKLITDLNILFLYDGCTESHGVFFTSLNSAVLSSDSDDVEVNRVLDGCGTQVSIDELPSQKWVTIYSVVDITEENTQSNGTLENRQVSILGHYEWQYNGRMYFSEIENTVRVTDRFEDGDQIN